MPVTPGRKQRNYYCLEVAPNRSGVASPTLASPLWLIRELSRQGRRLLFPKEKAAYAAFSFCFRSRLTSLSNFGERLSKLLVSVGKLIPQEQCRLIDDLIRQHHALIGRLDTNDRDCRTDTLESSATQGRRVIDSQFADSGGATTVVHRRRNAGYKHFRRSWYVTLARNGYCITINESSSCQRTAYLDKVPNTQGSQISSRDHHSLAQCNKCTISVVKGINRSRK